MCVDEMIRGGQKCVDLTHLYWKDDFPGRPCDLILRPIQKLYRSSKKYYPGFEAALRPPKTCKY
jgi:hypothetical protein